MSLSPKFNNTLALKLLEGLISIFFHVQSIYFLIIIAFIMFRRLQKLKFGIYSMQIRTLKGLKNGLFKFCTGPLKTINPTKFTGKLTVLPTPIGNLQDLSPNIIKALFKADVIGCEDRRVAGKLYTLIKSRNIMESIVQDFGEIGLKSIIPVMNEENRQKTQEEQNYLFYDYSNMNEKARRKLLRKMTKQQQQKFKIDFLKYRALKIMKKQDDFSNKQKDDKYDELYGIDSSDLEHIELQIRNTRMKKGRGVLIPLNTYSQTKMFNMVKMFLETKNVAIISDAGMPCISDPGWKMVRKIRESHPQVQIQVIGGPSSVSLMNLLASLSLQQNKNSMSGRFQGFAPQQVSQMTQKSIQIQEAKKKQFSIHFINSKKLRKKALELEKVYGAQQRIILANELTKLYQRKYHGNLSQLNSEMSKQGSQFEGIGQLSYLVYPDNKSSQPIVSSQFIEKQKSKVESDDIIEKQKVSLPRLSLVSISNFIDSIKDSQVRLDDSAIGDKEINEEEKSNQKVRRGNGSQISAKDMIDLICSVFGIKASQARKMVYEKQLQLRNKRIGIKPNPFDQKKVASYEKQKPQNVDQQTNERVGRRSGRRKSQKMSADQLQFLKMLQDQKANMF